jgi:hypothetical protein
MGLKAQPDATNTGKQVNETETGIAITLVHQRKYALSEGIRKVRRRVIFTNFPAAQCSDAHLKNFSQFFL